MKTLLEISQLPKDQYKVIDGAKTQLYPLSWNNIITILHDGKSIRVRRKAAFEMGLCDGVNPVYRPEPTRGGKREGSGAKKLPDGDKKRPHTIYVTDNQISKLGGLERFKRIINLTINQRIS